MKIIQVEVYMLKLLINFIFTKVHSKIIHILVFIYNFVTYFKHKKVILLKITHYLKEEL